MPTELRPNPTEPPRLEPPSYELEPDGAFRIDRYDLAPPFCSFLPGVAGADGVPLWCMYVNRAQAVVSFGVRDKDHAIAEFLPATWAYQLVGTQGFRTFCSIDGAFYEPFRPVPAEHPDCRRTMRIRLDGLEIVETNPRRGLVFQVEYFSPVNRTLGSLARRLTITNTGRQTRRLRVLDGLALILPAGVTDGGLKAMRHIHEAYVGVRLACDHVPFYSLKVAAHDEAEVVNVTGGNFYAAWLVRDGRLSPVQPFVDPHTVFGSGHDLVTPRHFIARETLDPASQVWENRLPCALAPLYSVLEAGDSIELVALAGFAPDDAMLARFLSGFQRHEDLDAARRESREVMEEIVAPARSVSGLPVLDAYVRQNYLDNVLRGGIPVSLPSATGPALLHLYARRHGDLERDYNFFITPAQPLSAGAGNYRDICQNRRWNVWFYPDGGELEIKTFAALLQADGYNPLSVDGYRWRLPADADPLPLCPGRDPDARESFRRLVQAWFEPGEMLAWANRWSEEPFDRSAWLRSVLASCECRLFAHGHEGGYWIDHWTYITDLLEAYAAVYPDRVGTVLTGQADVTWFDEGATVVPRADKYALRANRWRQLHAVADGPPSPRPLPAVTLFGKLCALAAVKAVSFDCECRGIEMEAGRPGWNDSLNGLPGLFGSSTCEAAELARLAGWLIGQCPDPPDTAFPTEVADFIEEVVQDLDAADYSWDRAATVRERFRANLRREVSGRTRVVPGDRLRSLLGGTQRRALAAVERSIDPRTGLLHTYYANEPQRPPSSIGALEFHPRPLPLFLEGQVHWQRLRGERGRARAVYEAVRRSPLFDERLEMYKLNECLGDCSHDIGRARTFTRGWFENESIWLHMAYKYLLELLRCGLHEEFFRDAATMLVPFMDPAVYGRSILENSSFLASSANPDPATHGRGFIARLSGASAEFIHMWLLLTVGRDPFRVEQGELRFGVRPVLPGSWFTEQPATIQHDGRRVEIPANSFACTLLGTTLLVYHNASRRDTFGPAALRPVRYVLDGRDSFEGACLGTKAATRIRERQCRRLDVWLQ